MLGSYSQGLLLIAEPYILIGLSWCWDCYLFLNKGVIHIPLQSLSEGLLIAMIMFLVNLVEMLWIWEYEYESLKNDFALVDVWHNLHPASREFTWFNSSQSIGSRLDKFFISRDLLSPGIECDISLVRFPIMISFLLFLTSPLGSNK